MSGHYMTTSANIEQQEKAAAPEAEMPIESSVIVAAPGAPLPDIGTMVVYLARPGEGRAGKTSFPAVVMHHEPDGESLVLLVIYDVDDMVQRPAVREVSDDVFWPAWRHVRGQAPEKFDPSRLNVIRRDLDEAREQLDEMNRALYGEWERPNKSVLEFLVEFETALKSLRKRVAKIEGPPPAMIAG